MTALIDFSLPLEINDSLAADLDIFDFSNYFLDIRDRDEIVSWLRKYLSRSIPELRRRSGALMKLSRDDGAEERFAHIVRDLKELAHAADELPRRENKMSHIVCKMRIMELYIRSVHALDSEFSELPELRGIVRAFVNDDLRRAEDILRAAHEEFKPPRRVSLGVNINSTLNATHVGIIDIDTESAESGSLLSGSKNVTGLLDTVPNRRKNEMAHLELYILSRIERERSSEINRAYRILSDFDLEPVREWLKCAEGAELYLAGLRCLSYLKRRGCPAVPAVYGGEKLRFEELYYPHLVMVSENARPVPYNASVSIGQATIVTGANHSGKTSYLRAIAQSCILAFLGFPVPAKLFELPDAVGIHTVFAFGEDNSMADSRFGMESQLMRKMIDTVKQGWFVFMNEPFTSTNPVESADIICDIIAQLHEKRVTQMIVTHIYDVYFHLKEKNIPVKGHMTRSELCGSGIKFFYDVVESAPDGNSYAHAIAHQYGLEPELLMDAEAASHVREYLDRRSK